MAIPHLTFQRVMSMLRKNTIGLIVVLFLPCASILSAQEAAPPLSIEEAVQTALSRNLNVRAARQQAAAAGARIRAARADSFPQLQASAEYRRITSPASFEIPSLGPGIPPREVAVATEENVVGTVAARQAVYTGGRIPAQISRAEALLDAALGRLASTEAQVALQTREAYYGVLLSQGLVRSAERSLAAAREQLAAATAKFEAGTAAQFDVLRAQTQVSEAEQNLAEARNQVEITRMALNRILAAPLEQVRPLSEPGLAPFPMENLPSLVETAGRQRPELLAARAQLAAAEQGIRLAESQRRPEFDLSAGYQTVSKETPAQTTGWTFSAIVSMEIFDGGRTRANIAEARSLRDEARTNLEDTSMAVEQDVRQAYLNLQTARQTIKTAKTRLAQAEEAHSVATVRYEAGVGTAVELADALAALTAARTNVDRATFNYNIACAALQRALGRTTY